MHNTSFFFFLRNSFFEVCKYIILFVINEMEGKGQHHKQEHISFSPAHDPRIANTSASCFCVLRQEPPQRQLRVPPSVSWVQGLDMPPATRQGSCALILAGPFSSFATSGTFLQLPGRKLPQYQIGFG